MAKSIETIKTEISKSKIIKKIVEIERKPAIPEILTMRLEMSLLMMLMMLLVMSFHGLVEVLEELIVVEVLEVLFVAVEVLLLIAVERTTSTHRIVLVLLIGIAKHLVRLKTHS